MNSVGLQISLLLVVLFQICLGRNVQHDWDPKGYVMYCPCMGRFGSQVDQFLGSLLYSQKTGRVLVIPPFISYQHEKGHDEPNIYVPFDHYFSLDKVREYHPDVILMHDFMDNLAPMNWPAGQRFAYCSSQGAEHNDGNCPRAGNPFATFWEHFDITFEESVIWEGDFHYNVEYDPWRENWQKEYPASKHPVIALMSAPAISPISDVASKLQEYLQWQPDIVEEGDKYISENLHGPFLGIHLRNGADWVRTCKLADGSYHQLMSSRQCTGVRHDNSAPITPEMCLQSEEQVIQDLALIIKKEQPKAIFIATDNEAMVEELEEAFPDVPINHLDPEKPQIDLYILGQSDHFVGNCVSAFSHYVRRERDVDDKVVTYFGWKGSYHDEL